MNILEILRMLLGSLFILFVPGLAWSYVFFTRKNIDWIGRVALSFGLSIALVPISLFWLNWLFHMKITLLSVSATVGGLTVSAMIYTLVKRDKRVINRLKSAYYFRKDKQSSDL